MAGFEDAIKELIVDTVDEQIGDLDETINDAVGRSTENIDDDIREIRLEIEKFDDGFEEHEKDIGGLQEQMIQLTTKLEAVETLLQAIKSRVM
jgi:chromosome segregation ATPase